ncbi:hypothetical protein FRC19_000126 [Serendipita sp. 401]|nr:hypothetical protein FRC19_000126 [Serendipita sp. 401]KAG9058811.1 hypothetical protein FS842_000008 [Serendipita sp. 407]
MPSNFLSGLYQRRPKRHRHSPPSTPPPPPRPAPHSTPPPIIVHVGSHDHQPIRIPIQKVYNRESRSNDRKENGHSPLVLEPLSKETVSSHSKTYEPPSYRTDDTVSRRQQHRGSPPPRPHSRAGSHRHSTHHRSTDLESNSHSSSYEKGPKVALYYSRSRDGEVPIFLRPSSSQHHSVRPPPPYTSSRDHGFLNDKSRSNGRRRSPMPSRRANSRPPTSTSNRHSKQISDSGRSDRRGDLISGSSRSAHPVQSTHRQYARGDKYSTKVTADKDRHHPIYPPNDSRGPRHNQKDRHRHVRFLLPHERESSHNIRYVRENLFLQQFHPERLPTSNRPSTPPNWSTHVRGRPRPQGYYNRRGDRLIRRGVIVRQKDPSMEWADVFSGYPQPGMGWRNETGHWLPEGGGILRNM